MPAPRTTLQKTSREITKRDSTRYMIAWTNPISNETIQIRITHTRGYLAAGQDHIEVRVQKPRGARLPITETGYRSHFISATELINAGGPVTFVTAWIEREAKSRDWQKHESARAQGNLFDWADQAKQVAKRQPRATTAKRTPTPRRRVVPDPDHVADLELSDSQRGKRMAARDRGKPVAKPKGVE